MMRPVMFILYCAKLSSTNLKNSTIVNRDKQRIITNPNLKNLFLFDNFS